MSYKDEIRAVLVSMDNHENQQQREANPQTPPEDQIQDIYVYIVREQEDVAEDQAQVVDSTTAVPTHSAPVSLQQDSFLSAYLFVCFSLFLILSTLAFQLYCIANPPIATVTIIPKSKQVSLSGTVQLGRLLHQITISQSQTTATTGHGHQPAAQARGYITFYNGQFQSVTIAAGTILTGASGVQVMTDQDAPIPAANPPSFGVTIVSAHAISPGSIGNIAAYDINVACCATSVLAKNTSAFYSGQDARSYATVTQHDIHSVSTMLKTTLIRSVTGALQGLLQPGERLQLLPCSPMVNSNHQAGEEAKTVTVTVSQTCSAVAYNSQQLETKATTFLASQAQYKTGTGYSLLSTADVSVTQASITHASPPLVFLSFSASGTWVYALNTHEQQRIQRLIAGKTTREAAQLLAAVPGIARASLSFAGFGDATRMPRSTRYIHLMLIVV
jgi:hypothetical protein